MEPNQLVRIDGMRWWIVADKNGLRTPVALCPQHNLRLTPVPVLRYDSIYRKNVARPSGHSVELECAEGPHRFELPRNFDAEKKYVIDRTDALVFANMSTLNLDEEAILVAEEELKDKSSPYWIKARVTESKTGVRLIIWAGDRSRKNKAQLFVEPEIKRLSFDQNDDHPTEVFARVEATFANKVKGSISKK